VAADALPAGSLTIPASASIHGLNGTYFRTDLRLLNQSYTDSVTVDLDYPGVGHSGSVTLAPREARELRDVVGTFFAAPETSGGITIRWSGGPVIASSRTYTDGAAGGTIGTQIPALEDYRSMTGALFVALSSSGGDLTKGFRSNAGVFNPGYYAAQASATVTFVLYDSLGHPLGIPLTTQVGGTVQINNIFAALGAGTVATKNARLVVTSSVPVFSYVTVIDNITGDSFYVPAEYTSNPFQAGRTALYPIIPVPDVVIPAAVSKHGVNGVLFQTDLWLQNTSSTSGATTLTFASIEDGLTVVRTATVSMAPLEVRLYEDIVHSLFGATESFGPVHVLPNGFTAFSRTYSATQDGQGTIGTELPAIYGSLYGRFVFLGVASNGGDTRSGFRTNVGASGYGVFSTHTALLFDSSGRPLGNAVPLYLPADTPVQVNDIFAAAGVPSTVTTNATLVLDSPGSAIYPYVTVIDNRSGDSVALVPQVDISPP
jgi:plastocyanin